MKFVGYALCGAEMGNSYNFSVGNPGRKRPLGEARHR
jgi:hypothetical protein